MGVSKGKVNVRVNTIPLPRKRLGIMKNLQRSKARSLLLAKHKAAKRAGRSVAEFERDRMKKKLHTAFDGLKDFILTGQK
jgi:hypothetical protein